MESTAMPRKPETTLSDQLRDVIRRKPSAYAVAKAAGIDTAVVQRFLDAERGLTTASIDKIAKALGLRLVETGRGAVPDARPRRGGRTTRKPEPGAGSDVTDRG
jgi:hypothetical protein